jgi:hypothetical protein
LYFVSFFTCSSICFIRRVTWRCIAEVHLIYTTFRPTVGFTPVFRCLPLYIPWTCEHLTAHINSETGNNGPLGLSWPVVHWLCYKPSIRNVKWQPVTWKWEQSEFPKHFVYLMYLRK